MTTEGIAAVFAMDAGGTGTRIGIEVPAEPFVRAEVGSINRAAVGERSARDSLRSAFEIVAAHTRGRRPVGWLATASIVAETAQEELATVASVVPDGWMLVVSNDALPLLLAPPLADRGVVVIAGTGSALLGGDGRRILHVGNHEYLGADDGSAFDIGLRGLRAALRAYDGLGPRSSLVQSLSAAAGRDLAAEARRLAATPFPKQSVADLAPAVVRSWLEGDEVAGGVIAAAVESLVSSAVLLRRRLALSSAEGTLLAGGLFSGCAQFRSAVTTGLVQSAGPHPVLVCADPTAAVLSCARRLLLSGPDAPLGHAYLGEHAWFVGAR